MNSRSNINSLSPKIQVKINSVFHISIFDTTSLYHSSTLHQNNESYTQFLLFILLIPSSVQSKLFYFLFFV